MGVQIVSRYLREQAEKSSVSSGVRIKKEDDTKDFSILRGGEIQNSPGPIGSISSDTGITRPAVKNFAKVIDLDSDSDNGSSGTGAELDCRSLKSKVLSPYEEAKIESEDESNVPPHHLAYPSIWPTSGNLTATLTSPL